MARDLPAPERTIHNYLTEEHQVKGSCQRDMLIRSAFTQIFVRWHHSVKLADNGPVANTISYSVGHLTSYLILKIHLMKERRVSSTSQLPSAVISQSQLSR
jgi:hypothetical protein